MNALGYDAILIVSFGGPEGPDDVMPFLENVTAGRGVPRERLELVAKHYLHRGGISPINGHNRQLVDDLTDALAVEGIDLPVYWGNRNWHPFIGDAVRQMRDDGVERAIAYVTSAFSSYSGCRQYRENIAAAQDALDAGVSGTVPTIDKLRVFHDHPLFIETMADHVAETMTQSGLVEAAASGDRTELSEMQWVGDADRHRLVFTAHSIPTSLADSSDYVAQLNQAAGLVVERLRQQLGGSALQWDLVYQSRSGPPQMPWLEPDIVDHIDTLGATDGIDAVTVCPLGFMSDHMEVMQDLDTDAAIAAERHRLAFARVPTAGQDARIPQMIIELIRERSGAARQSLGALEIKPDVCAQDCCPAPRRPARRPPAD